MCTPDRPRDGTRPHALTGSDSARWQRTTSGEGPKGPHYLGLAVTSCEKIGSVARVIRPARGDWLFRGGGSKLPRHKAQASLRTPKARLWVFAAFASLLWSGCSRQDMHDQPKYKPLRGSAFFEDSLSARPSVPGTVARGHLKDDLHLYTGRVSQTSASQKTLPLVRPPGIDAKSPVAAQGPIFVDTFPFPITREVLERGRERFDIFCSVCHGRLGTGEGMVVRRGFRQPPSYHIDRLKEARVGHFFDVITNGFGAMPDYAAQIHVRDRWAIVAYIRALQLSQNVPLGDVPAEGRSKLGIARERR
jgi:mono/diheme cytochrome c family protein